MTPETPTVHWRILSKMFCPPLDQIDGGSPGKVGSERNIHQISRYIVLFTHTIKVMENVFQNMLCLHIQN